MKRAVEWPRYMTVKRLASGGTAFYWAAQSRDYKAGFTIRAEALGTNAEAAARRARLLNEHLDAWREHHGTPPALAGAEREGTIDWWIRTYCNHEAFIKLKPRTQSDYREALSSIADLPTSLKCPVTGEPVRMGTLLTSSISPEAADKIYAKLRRGGKVNRQADYAIDVARRAWKVVRRAHPGLFLVPVTGQDGKTSHLAINPFEGVERAHYERDTAIPVSRSEVLAFAKAAKKEGHPALGVAALICFEWHQRPEDVRKGRITWTDYRPKNRPNKVQVFHHKTRKRVWKVVETTPRGEKRGRQLYPELSAELASLPRLGVPIVMFEPKRGAKDADGRRVPRLYSEPYAQHLVQAIREAAKLPAHFTLEACRHGGMTELGDAELTEQEIMTLSTHATPQASRLYVKRTERQEQRAATKRRNYVERSS